MDCWHRDHDPWKPIERKALAVYRTYGERRLDTLSRYITNTTTKATHHDFLRERHWDSRHRLEGVRLPVWTAEVGRSHQLFGCDPAT